MGKGAAVRTDTAHNQVKPFECFVSISGLCLGPVKNKNHFVVVDRDAIVFIFKNQFCVIRIYTYTCDCAMCVQKRPTCT